MTTTTSPPVLTDGVVTLRTHRAEDVPGIVEQCRDPLSRRWTTVPEDYALEQAEDFVHSHAQDWERGRWRFAVEAYDGDVARFCGTVELRDEGDRRAEIAYGAHPWARGRGLVHRALSLLVDWGFAEQHLRTVVWWANTGNWASRRAAWRLGFSCDGTVRRWLPQRGDLVDGWVGTLHVEEARTPRHEWLTVPTLTAPEVVLRALRESDTPRVVEAFSDERSKHWFAHLPSPYALVDAERWLLAHGERLASGTGLSWALADPGSDVLVGSISLRDLEPGREAVVGFWTHPEARGRGLMTRACGLVAGHAFAPADEGGLGLVRLSAGVADGNTASQHVLETVGFTRAGRLRRALPMRDGGLADDLVYDLLADEQGSSATAG